MNIWICKNTEDDFELNDYEHHELVEEGDEIYTYTDDYESGSFLCTAKYQFISGETILDPDFESINIELPYTVLYKTKNGSFLYKLEENEKKFILNIETPTNFYNTEEKSFKNFLKKKDYLADLTPNGVTDNISFIIGQPNTGKSYSFEEKNLFDGIDSEHYVYKKIPVSGGIGNEYKGLQNTDLAITFDPIKTEIRFGEFLQILMSAIVNPKIPHVVFLDDFHNQDISSLLSEYTPLFKSQQKRIIKDLVNDDIFQDEFESTEMFIDTWNDFITTHCEKDIDEDEVPKVGLTNRISGNSIMLVFPANFYLLGAANFNENTLNIFADWEDRAKITYKHPITTFDKSELEGQDDEFLNCCIELNEHLKEILKEKNIFDSERYCFGMWKIVNTERNLITDNIAQTNIIKFFFGMIKNSLKFNNKNSLINDIGWSLMKKMQSNTWFQANIISIRTDASINYEELHRLNIYEDDI